MRPPARPPQARERDAPPPSPPPALTTVPLCERRSLDVKWRTLLKPLSQGEGGHLPTWAAEHGWGGSPRPPGGTPNAHAAACTGTAAAPGGALGGRACACSYATGGPLRPRASCQHLPPRAARPRRVLLLMMACGTRLCSSGGAESITGRLRSVAGQGIRVPRGGSGAGALWGRNTAAARVLRAADAHCASVRRGDYRRV